MSGMADDFCSDFVAKIKAAATMDDVVKIARDAGAFIHIDRRPACEHEFAGWVELDNGGSTKCTKCGMLAIDDPRI